MRGLASVALLAALVVAGAASGTLADNNTCLQSGGAWTAAGTVKAVTEFEGNYFLELSEKVVATPPNVKSAMQPVITGECLVGWGAGADLPEACKAGSPITMTGPLSIDDQGVAGVQVRELTCG